uniref:transposase n=1 Tax=Achromobacter sp. TaxID=134375 RepID=UPI001BB4AF63|nr:Insertion element ISR1 10 kDa protein A3 [Achromobacter sp.]
MKRSRFSEEQIAYALRLAESGTPVIDVCRQIGRVRSDVLHVEEEVGDLGVTELKRLKMLEDENARLKRIVADLTLDKQILQEVVRKKL